MLYQNAQGIYMLERDEASQRPAPAQRPGKGYAYLGYDPGEKGLKTDFREAGVTKLRISLKTLRVVLVG
jgi:hypothetical protein